MKELLSIVIPCKNEKTILVECLYCLKDQDNIDTVKIIIADDSTDNTLSLVTFFNQFAKLNIEYIKGGLPAIARNNGAKITTTPYVLFLDSDTYLYDKNTINKCLDICIKGDYDLVTCKFKTDKKYNWLYRIFDIFQWYSSITKPFALGGFMLFKTNTFNKLGGFNEEDKIAEDYHISSKIKPKCFKIANYFVYTPSRRFGKKGVWYMIKLAWNSWLNRNNDNFFKQDYNYWK
jgi:glycosyltransferase involved in cell wall biosynthesis